MNKILILAVTAVSLMASDSTGSERKYEKKMSNAMYELQRKQEYLFQDWSDHCVFRGKQLQQKASGVLSCLPPLVVAPKPEVKSDPKKEDKK